MEENKGKKTYKGAIEIYNKIIMDKKSGKKIEIGRQFEYNQYTRDFFEDNPESSREGCIKCWKYTSVMKSIDKGEYISDIIAGNCDKIKLYKHKIVDVCSIKSIGDDYYNGNIDKAYYEYIEKIFRTTNAQTSIRTKVIEATKKMDDEYFSIVYIPIKGKNAGKITRSYYKRDNLIAWLKDVVTVKDKKIIKLDNMGNLWDDIQ
jgi:adenine-specific DNA-methyltransferase